MRPDHVTSLEGIPILTVEVTLLLLAGELDDEEFRFAFWEADRKDLIDEERLLDCLEICQGRRGGREFIELVGDRLPGVSTRSAELWKAEVARLRPHIEAKVAPFPAKGQSRLIITCLICV